jgi:hypothetical protein
MSAEGINANFPMMSTISSNGRKLEMQNRHEKAVRGYVEADSRVRFDGSETLVGKDWKKRKQELWNRAGGRCEQLVDISLTMIPVRCRTEGHDPHHIIPRSKGRDDRLENLQLLCRLHHDLLDWKKLKGRDEKRTDL